MTAAPPPAERGRTVIAERAVRRIAARAAAEGLPPDAAGGVHASASVHGRRARIALRTPLPYPDPVAEAAYRLQRRVAERVGALTGLAVAPPRMRVTRLAPATGAADPPEAAQAPERPGRARRPWSARRVPAALLALAAAAAAGAATADLVRVHLLGLPPAAWRTWALDRLAGLSLGDPVVTALGGASVLAGAVLVVLAATPGLRRLRPAAAPAPGWRAAVDRSAVAALLRGAVGDIPGVAEVAVRTGRRRVRVRVRVLLAFGDAGSVRTRAATAAAAALARCGLARTPRLAVTVTPSPGWLPPPDAAAAGPAPDLPARAAVSAAPHPGGERR